MWAYYEQALDFELAAIGGLSEQSGLAWDILHRSAGWLAMDCNLPEQAAQLAKKRWPTTYTLTSPWNCATC